MVNRGDIVKERINARLNKKDVEDRLSKKNITLLSEYTVMRDKGLFECNKCKHKWEAKLESVVSNRNGCPRCAGFYKTNKTIQEDLKDKPFKFIDDYKGAKNKYKFRCDCGNIFEASISNAYRRKRGCGNCNRSEFADNKELFEEKAYESVKTFFDLIEDLNYEALNDYKKNMDVINIKCNKHNEIWETRPNYILNGHGRCKKCIDEEITEKRIIRQKERFEEKIKDDNFIKLVGEFKGLENETDFECLVCGNIYKTKPVYYYYYNSRCPKCKASKGELKIIKYLNEKNIKYKHEYSFDEFRGKRNRLYRFDFAILGKRNGVKALIEYDGIMHYKKKRKNQDLFECMERDNIKSEYAKKKKIKLIRIPYWEIDNIENILDRELKGVV